MYYLGNVRKLWTVRNSFCLLGIHIFKFSVIAQQWLFRKREKQIPDKISSEPSHWWNYPGTNMTSGFEVLLWLSRFEGFCQQVKALCSDCEISILYWQQVRHRRKDNSHRVMQWREAEEEGNDDDDNDDDDNDV